VETAWRATEIPGLFQTARQPIVDQRGGFQKIVGEGDNAECLPFLAREIYWSTSVEGVFRGLHFQTGARDTRKAVFVTGGMVRDFVLDLRKGSPTERFLWEGCLHAQSGGLIIPRGCAHGFEVIQGPVSMVYGQEEYFSPKGDAGINFVSAGVKLESPNPVISARDLALPSLDSYDSPFEFA
jgi:dTDP-4-dehydrorhamnose 3,5-epimerase